MNATKDRRATDPRLKFQLKFPATSLEWLEAARLGYIPMSAVPDRFKGKWKRWYP